MKRTPTPSLTEAVLVPEQGPAPALPPILIHGEVEIPAGYLSEADQRSLLGLPAAPRRTGGLAWLRPIEAVVASIDSIDPPIALPDPATILSFGAGLPEFSLVVPLTYCAAGSFVWRRLSAVESSGEVLRAGRMWRSGRTFFFCYRHDATAGYQYRCVRMSANQGTWRFEMDAFENDRLMWVELEQVEAVCEPILTATTSTALASLQRYALQCIGPSHEEIKDIFRNVGLDLDDLFAAYGELNPP